MSKTNVDLESNGSEKQKQRNYFLPVTQMIPKKLVYLM